MTTYSDTTVNQPIVNKLTKTQFDNASSLNPTEEYQVDPEFTGGKVLATDSNGDIVEALDVPTTTQTLSATDSITLANGVVYNGSEITSLTVAPPSTGTLDFVAQVNFTSGTTATTFPPSTIKYIGDSTGTGMKFTPLASTRYTILYYYNGVDFIGVVKGI